MSRRCHDCGATGAEAEFPGTRKPRGAADRCVVCIAEPLIAGTGRVRARLRVIATLRAIAAKRGRHYRSPKPAWTAPLFRELRP